MIVGTREESSIRLYKQYKVYKISLVLLFLRMTGARFRIS